MLGKEAVQRHMVNSIDYILVNMYELINCLSIATDLISSRLRLHHQRVAYLAQKIAEQVGLSSELQRKTVLAGLLHDIGAISLVERLELIENEPPHIQDHAFKGAGLIEGFGPLQDVANIIRYHHMPWEHGRGTVFMDKEVPFESHIIHLADRIAGVIRNDWPIQGQISGIQERIDKQKGIRFVPELVDAFLDISVKEYIWLDMTYEPLLNIVSDSVLLDTLDLDLDDVISLTRMFARIIDFRSPYTANHTVGVAKVAEKLGQLMGFSENECKMLLVAGYLHDLGKLAIRNDILEKPGKLTEEEFNIIKSHVFYTYRLLQSIKGFDVINVWASFHHEKLNGEGYPFRLTDRSIPLGARIVAVADIFTALAQDRPYRKGMSLDDAISVLNSMASERAICSHVVSVLAKNVDMINEYREEAQQQAEKEYDDFLRIRS